MKHLIISLIIIGLLGCATTGGKAQKMEFSNRQNLINLGITIVGAGITGLVNGYMLRKTGDGVQAGIEDGLNGMHRY